MTTKSIQQEIAEIETKLSWMNVRSDRRDEYEARLEQLKRYEAAEGSRAKI